jgi:hypothetical protein
MPRKSEHTTYECSYHLLPNMQITNGTQITDHDITEEPSDVTRAKLSAQHNLQTLQITVL